MDKPKTNESPATPGENGGTRKPSWRRPLTDAIPADQRALRTRKVYSDRGGKRREIRPLTEEQRRLAVRHLPLARSLTRRVESLWPTERDDIRSTAYMALVEAARNFDPERGISFSTFARHRIRGDLREFQRLLYSAGVKGCKRDRPALRLLGDDPEVQEKIGQVVGINADPPVGKQFEEIEAVEVWLSRLPERLALACRLIYLHGNSHTDAAKAIGYSRSYFSRLHDEAMTRLSHEHEFTEQQPETDELSLQD